MIIWITGLSGSGKTTLAEALYNNIKKIKPNTLWIDGDVLRKNFQNTKKYDVNEIPKKKIYKAIKFPRKKELKAR